MRLVWLEFRAYVATVLMGWAMRAHFDTYLDLCMLVAKIAANKRLGEENQ